MTDQIIDALTNEEVEALSQAIERSTFHPQQPEGTTQRVEQVSHKGPASKLPLSRDVAVQLEVVFGTAQMPVHDLLSLKAEQVVTLDTLAGESVELKANGVSVAKGEVVITDDDHYGIRIVEVIS
ncbi:MAG: FliM/FliN family flagellar motor switch protein [Chlamydiales bacterium]|nr:FliM/FliN family flagellar motor switch protein [Chlamydiia bacterium]MCP5507100.1 FliM/FliN family flagellar motor switch protein [Chlamydiales bacterium]